MEGVILRDEQGLFFLREEAASYFSGLGVREPGSLNDISALCSPAVFGELYF